ncbi:MAG: ferritin-like domain-containing protein [Alphaproteobacteria bacterium]|nr:ferritin-like domain-containing protein [Alphaproteobacteria bacterium]
MRKHWTLEDIDWDRFDRSKVDAEMVAVVKAAAMVEHNGGDYAIYLCNVFQDDPEFQEAARHWAEEEVQHGLALKRWAELVDPNFDFEAGFKCFRDGYRLPLEAADSVRGSRAGELVARCIVETGTSSYYRAIGDATDEPVLKQICGHIAADEIRHYRLFYSHLERYLRIEGIGRWRRLLVALGRLGESEDDELAYAYYAANDGVSGYDRRRFTGRVLGTSFGYYQPSHMRRAVKMILRAVGLRHDGMLARLLAPVVYRLLRWRSRQLQRAAMA